MQGRSKVMISTIIFILYVVLSSVGMVLIKKEGANVSINIGGSSFVSSFSWLFIIAILMYVISFFLWIYVLQIFPLTYISPMAYGLVYVCIALLSYYLLNEIIDLKMWIGCFLIILGVVVSSVKI